MRFSLFSYVYTGVMNQNILIIQEYNYVRITCRLNVTHHVSVERQTHPSVRCFSPGLFLGKEGVSHQDRRTALSSGTGGHRCPSSAILPALLWFSQSRHGEARSQKVIPKELGKFGRLILRSSTTRH